MGDQRIKFDIAAAHQSQELFHVPVFRPTDVSKRIVASLFLVRRIVAAGTVSPSHEKLDLLQVHVVPRELHLHCANHNNAPAVTADIESQFARSGRLRCGRDNDTIRALAVRSRHYLFFEGIAAVDRLLHAKGLRQINTLGPQICGDHDRAL